jgi:ABC-type phosphate transport system ATPase subunit
MISYKKIDMLNLVLKDNSVCYNDENLIIKSPIINYDIKDDKLMLIINADSDAHSTFLNLCSYIERLFKNVKIKADIIKNRNDINNRSVIISMDKNCKFYDINREEIFKNNIKSSGKIMCSFLCEEGKLKLSQLLQIK